MLAAMFSGRHSLETTEDGSFFIDRDGTYFRFILNYLRNDELILPEGGTLLEELEAEARFYQPQGVLDKLKAARAFEKSVILQDFDRGGVSKCLNKTDTFGFYSYRRMAFAVSFQMRQERTYNHCCKNWWKHFWRLH